MKRTDTAHVEYLFAWDDGTWTTEILDVPPGMTEEAYLSTLYDMQEYHGTVLIAVYNADLSEEDLTEARRA